MKDNSIVKGIALGAGVAAMVYFLYGSTSAAKNRKKTKKWILDAKGEVIGQLKKLSKVSEGAYHKIIKEVSDKYQALKNINKKDIAEFSDELKGHWKNIAKEMGV